jgi:hypothetical protein
LTPSGGHTPPEQTSATSQAALEGRQTTPLHAESAQSMNPFPLLSTTSLHSAELVAPSADLGFSDELLGPQAAIGPSSSVAMIAARGRDILVSCFLISKTMCGRAAASSHVRLALD